jgi:hypothetical protein
VPVLVHQLIFAFRRERQSEPLAGIAQAGAGEFPERLVVLPVVAGGDQPRVLDLLVAPQHAERVAVAGEQLLREQAHAVHIEQRAIGIEQDGLGFLH